MTEVITEREATERFKDFLDEIYDSVTICGCTFAPSEILEADGAAFNVGLNDYIDSIEYEGDVKVEGYGVTEGCLWCDSCDEEYDPSLFPTDDGVCPDCVSEYCDCETCGEPIDYCLGHGMDEGDEEDEL